MSQQIPDIAGKPYETNDNYTRRLFIMTAFGYTEVANARGVYEDEVCVQHKIARIVNDYTPPTPEMKTTEIKISNAPSKIHADGKSMYKIQLRLLFPDKITYNDFMFLCQNQFKFYDERGGIYTCVMTNTEVERVEAGRRYDVKITLQGTRKEVDDRVEVIDYTDTVQQGHKLYIRNSDIVRMHSFYITFTSLGKTLNLWFDYTVDSTQRDLSLFIYKALIENDIGADYSIKYNKDEYSISLMPKSSSINGNITFDPGSSNLDIDISSVTLDHWAKEYIDSAARLGLIAQYDRSGNLVYTFSPEAFASRAMMASVFNRLKNYIGKVIKG